MISPIGKSKNKGSFTLIELLMVIVIIGLLLAVSTPLFRNTFANLQLSETVQNIASTIRYCYASSIAESVVYRLHFDFQNNTYYMTKQDPASEEFYRVGTRFGKTAHIASGINIEGQTDEIHFYPDGRVDETIFLVTNSGGAFKIEVGNMPGIVKISEYEAK